MLADPTPEPLPLFQHWNQEFRSTANLMYFSSFLKVIHSTFTVVRLALVRTWRLTSLSPAPSVYRAAKPKIFLAKLRPAEGHVSVV